MLVAFFAFLGFAAMAVAFANAIGHLKRAERVIAKLQARKEHQVERIRRLGTLNLHLAREIRDARHRRDTIQAALDDTENRLHATLARNNRMYILDDRRTGADSGWVVRVSNPDYAQRVNPNLERFALESWRQGRRFLVWALDDHKARDKVSARYPDHKGFMIESVEKSYV